MKNIFFFLIILPFIQANAEEMLCKDFQCLAENSKEQYLQSWKHWWDIYHETAVAAKECKYVSDTRLFLTLWNGHTNGETREALFDDTEQVMTNKTECFLEALSELTEVQREAFFNGWCPFTGQPYLQAIKEYLSSNMKNEIAKRVLITAHSNECKI